RLLVNELEVLIQRQLVSEESLTSEVLSIDPSLGPRKGGTLVTLTARNFSEDARVFIDGAECVVTTYSFEQIECVTSAKTSLSSDKSFEISSELYGIGSSKNVRFWYYQRWTDPDTWDGTVPVEGESLVIPKGKVVLVDTSVVLGHVRVEGTLIWEDARSTTFECSSLLINGGSVYVGSENAPFQNELTLIINSQDSTVNNNKILLLEGVLELYGKEYKKTWTRLSESARKGSQSITVSDTTGWEVGHSILISSTSENHEESEKRTITSIEGNSILLSDPLDFDHFAGRIDLGETNYSLGAGVGLLSRNIRIRNKSSSGNVSIVSSGENTKLILSSVELVGLGSTNHADTTSSAVIIRNSGLPSSPQKVLRDCSIQNSTQSSVLLEHSSNVLVENNVIFGYTKNGISLNTGDNNTISRNLIVNNKVYTESTGVYSKHPNNEILHNQISGNSGSGIWLDLPDTVVSLKQNKVICPNQTLLGSLDSNTLLSNQVGLKILLTPKEDPCNVVYDESERDPYSVNKDVETEISGNVFVMNQKGLEADRLGAVSFTESKFISNRLAVSFGGLRKTNTLLLLLRNVVIVGDSEVSEFHMTSFSMKAILINTETKFTGENIKILNFTGSSVIELNNSGSTFRTQFFESVSFVNVTSTLLNFAHTNPKDIIFDSDGSLLRHLNNTISNPQLFTTGGWITPWSPHLRVPECLQVNLSLCSVPCAVCSREVDLLVVQHSLDFDFNTDFASRDLYLFNLDHEGFTTDTDFDETKFGVSKYTAQDNKGVWVSVLATGYAYNFHLSGGIDWERIQISNNPDWRIHPTNNAFLRHNFTQHRELFDSWFSGFEEDGSLVHDKEDTAVSEVLFDDAVVTFTEKHQFGDFYYNIPNKQILWKLDGRRIGEVSVSAVECRFQCESGEMIGERRWSDKAAWEERGRVPIEGDEVVIPEHWDMILDSTTPVLKSLVVFGTLRFDSGQPEVVLKAETIHIKSEGSILIGDQTNPYKSKARIELFGDDDSEKVYLPPTGPTVGKAILNQGTLQIHAGITKNISTRLSKSAKKGESTIYVQNSVTWKPGDRVVLGSSSTEFDEFEMVTVSENDFKGKITLTSGLKYFHFGSTQPFTTSRGVIDMRSTVASFTRNVKIVSKDLDTSTNYGGVLISKDAKKLVLEGVEFA
ncbi:MAG: G8 domain-containing protein, partial [Bacteroidota bacterium]